MPSLWQNFVIPFIISTKSSQIDIEFGGTRNSIPLPRDPLTRGRAKQLVVFYLGKSFKWKLVWTCAKVSSFRVSIISVIRRDLRRMDGSIVDSTVHKLYQLWTWVSFGKVVGARFVLSPFDRKVVSRLIWIRINWWLNFLMIIRSCACENWISNFYYDFRKSNVTVKFDVTLFIFKFFESVKLH